mgnify:CR=1 FL=1
MQKRTEGALKKPTSEIGKLEFETDKQRAMGHTFTAFLWPRKPDSGSLSTLAKNVSTDSRNIDTLVKEYRDLDARLERENAMKVKYRCTADDKPDPKPEVLVDCDPTLGSDVFCSCIASNAIILEKKGKESGGKRVALGEKIVKDIDADTGNVGTNWLLGGSEHQIGMGSRVSIETNQNGDLSARIRLENFGVTVSGKTQVYKSISVPADTALDDCGLPQETTPSDVGRIIKTRYDFKTKLLTFTLISKTETDAPGTRYEFVMERGFVPNGSFELTRFKGDLLKKNCAGQVVGFGSAKFDGVWAKKEPN